MKVIVSGSTGLIGGAVLERLIDVPSVTSIIALSRRDLSITDPKLHTVIVKDFLNYDQNVLDQMAGAVACIWCLGAPTSGRDVHMDFTMAATKACASSILPSIENGNSFRFVYTSGVAVVRDQDRSLWFLSGMRKMRGEIETSVMKLDEQHSPTWQSFVARPAMVTKGVPIWSFLIPSYWITVRQLATAMVDVALNGNSTQLVENADLREKGKAILESETVKSET